MILSLLAKVLWGLRARVITLHNTGKFTAIQSDFKFSDNITPVQFVAKHQYRYPGEGNYILPIFIPNRYAGLILRERPLALTALEYIFSIASGAHKGRLREIPHRFRSIYRRTHWRPHIKDLPVSRLQFYRPEHRLALTFYTKTSNTKNMHYPETTANWFKSLSGYGALSESDIFRSTSLTCFIIRFL